MLSQLLWQTNSTQFTSVWQPTQNSGHGPTRHRVNPLAIQLMEMYGEVTHGDWLRFLDEEILNVLPEDERELLATLAVSERPVPWDVLATVCNHDGNPPSVLVERGLLLELKDGMWLHEALRERLLREVGEPQDERRNKLTSALNG